MNYEELALARKTLSTIPLAIEDAMHEALCLGTEARREASAELRGQATAKPKVGRNNRARAVAGEIGTAAVAR